MTENTVLVPQNLHISALPFKSSKYGQSNSEQEVEIRNKKNGGHQLSARTTLVVLKCFLVTLFIHSS